MTDPLKITGLRVTHFAGLQEFTLEPSEITILAGQNGAGKTSVLSAIQTALRTRGGIPDEAIHVDHDRAEIRVQLSDGTDIRRARTRGKSQQVTVRRGDATFSKPAALIDGLLDPVSLDPVAWLDGDREQALLDAMPLEMRESDLADIWDRAGLPASERPRVASTGRHALKVIADVETRLMEQRRDLNATIRQRRAWIDSERADRPEVADPQAELERTAAALADVRRRIEAADTVAERHRMAVRGLESALIRTQRCQQRVAELRDMLRMAEADLADAQAAEAAARAAVDAADPPPDTSALEAQRDRLQAHLDDLRSRRGAYEEHLRTQARIEAEVARLQDEERRAEALTAAIHAIRAAPAEMLSRADLPIEGLSYDGQLRLHNVPVSMLSGAETIRLASRVAVHRVRQQRGQFILLDGLEQLDDEQRAAFLEEARASGVQWICTEVGIRPGDDAAMVVVMGAEQ